MENLKVKISWHVARGKQPGWRGLLSDDFAGKRKHNNCPQNF